MRILRVLHPATVASQANTDQASRTPMP